MLVLLVKPSRRTELAMLRAGWTFVPENIVMHMPNDKQMRATAQP
jgi:hypothetical protein